MKKKYKSLLILMLIGGSIFAIIERILEAVAHGDYEYFTFLGYILFGMFLGYFLWRLTHKK